MTLKKKTMDGNEAAAYISYAFSEVAAIYPITPSSPMAEYVDIWSANGQKNIFDRRVKLVEMQSEAGAVSAVHGALESGVLATSYTSSQGLMLMIPTMYRIAGQLKPGVIHVASRSVATHAISMFAEHSDVMACRQTGFAILASSNVQECMDLSAIVHLSAIKGHVPFLHFFDGFRTSHEIQKITCLDYKDLAALVDQNELEKFRKNSLNPEYPVNRTTGQYSDTYFQSREACNQYYQDLPDIVESYMGEINRLTARDYHLFNYYGAPDAKYLLISMGSISGPAQETVEYLNEKGEKVGLLDVHLYRPFSLKHFLDSIPETVERIVVMDRTKEPGALGEPLYEDVCSAFNDSSSSPMILACRYGLGSKDTTPGQIVTIIENLQSESPMNHFVVGIEDDVTYHSIPVPKEINIVPKDTVSCKFWGLGSDGTVGANKNSIKIIGDHTDFYVQAYFEYDGRKSGGVTRSHLRFGKNEIRSSYLVKYADFVACHNQSYIEKYDMIREVKPGGSFLLACNWNEEELDKHLPAYYKNYIAKNNINFFIINSTKIARELGLGSRTNIILQSAFFKIAKIIPFEEAAKHMMDAIVKSYGKKGDKVIQMNSTAVDQGKENLIKINVPASWSEARSDKEDSTEEGLPFFVRDIMLPVNRMEGDNIPVSAFYKQGADGTVPQGLSKYEKRAIAVNVPVWDSTSCIQCNQCSYVCPHATIRPFLLNKDEESRKPESFITIPANGKGLEDYQYRIQVSVLDCTGCGSCADVCPSKQKALEMKPLETQLLEQDNFEFALSLDSKNVEPAASTVKISQFRQPLLEYSGACAGCAETPYAKLVTQLFGDRMYLATATGCSQVWSTSFPIFPYTINKEGKGPATGGSLFENNAEFGLGIYLGAEQQREAIKENVETLANKTQSENIKKAAVEWLDAFDDAEKSKETSSVLKDALSKEMALESDQALCKVILNTSEHLAKKSVWMFGGDGWAYDIGYGGLDHVLASGANVNVLVFDNEMYSNTGGQASKATPTGAVAQFAAAGKRTKKKDLGLMAMSYGNVYVAQVAMGANQAQTLKAVAEAEAYNGPSLIIAYAPCISHGILAGMSKSQKQMKKAVDVGYWQLYRFNPALTTEGKNPFILDSKTPEGDYVEFLKGENRFVALTKQNTDLAAQLFERSEAEAKERYAKYQRLSKE